MEIISILKKILVDSYRTALTLFKIMIPVTIVVKILQETNMIPFIGKVLAPIMSVTGLPGEMGLVWATTMIANIYGGLLALISVYPSCPLNVAQLTILTTMMLVAHTFPIELQVSYRAGTRFLPMFILRFGFAIVYGIILNLIYKSTGWLNEPARIAWQASKNIDPTFMGWILKELKNYGMICIMIFSLISLMEILRRIRFMELLEKAIFPLVKGIGLKKEIIPLAVIGLTLGIAYGGALMINESKQKNIDRRQIFYALALMGLCHSMIEDSLLMIAVGGHWSGVFVFRILFSFLFTWMIVRVTQNWSDEKFKKYLVRGGKSGGKL